MRAMICIKIYLYKYIYVNVSNQFVNYLPKKKSKTAIYFLDDRRVLISTDLVYYRYLIGRSGDQKIKK